jgi:hypothetical protein
MSPSESRQATQDLMADIQKDDGSMTAHDLISAYASGPSRLRDTLTHLTSEQLRARPDRRTLEYPGGRLPLIRLRAVLRRSDA